VAIVQIFLIEAPDNDKVAAFARRWAGLVLTRRNDYVLKFD
jgi:hypothetical protein